MIILKKKKKILLSASFILKEKIKSMPYFYCFLLLLTMFLDTWGNIFSNSNYLNVIFYLYMIILTSICIVYKVLTEVNAIKWKNYLLTMSLPKAQLQYADCQKLLWEKWNKKKLLKKGWITPLFKYKIG